MSAKPGRWRRCLIRTSWYLKTEDQIIRRFIRNKRRVIELLNGQKQAIINRAVTRGVDPGVQLKASGIDWLGDVPENWEVKRADAVLRLVREQQSMVMFGDNEVFHYSIPSFVRNGDGTREPGSHINSTKLNLHGGELLVSKLNPHKTHVLLAHKHDVPTVCSSEFVPLVPISCLPAYAYYVYCSGPVCAYLTSHARSATRSHSRVEPDHIAKLWWAWPPSFEQQLIVAAIQVQVNPVESAIERTRREIGLLHEYRTRLITDVVAGKLDVRHIASKATAPTLAELEPLDNGEQIDDEVPEDLEQFEEVADAN